MSTRENTKTVSYCRDRDYSQHFVWTYDLNTDVYKCYSKAREDPRIGYMSRMKEHWDTLHPELNYFTPKQLRQQAINIEKKRAILDTVTFKAPENPNEIHQEHTINIEGNVETTNDPPVIESEDISTVESFDQELLDKITNTFTKYFNIYHNMQLRSLQL